MLWIDPIFKVKFALNHFKQFMQQTGEIFRQQKGRLTQRIKIQDQVFFIKQHYGVGIKEILKNLLQAKWPVISAKNEWLALLHLQKQGVLVPQLYAYGMRGILPSNLKSFVLMEAILPSISLEDYTKSWKTTRPAFLEKRSLIKAVAQIVKTMHESGMNHRDLYICHFLLKENTEKNPKLFLIDLHRAQIHAKLPPRLQIKDLAALYFSSKDIQLTHRDLYYFIKHYRNKKLKLIMQTEAALWNSIQRRGEKLYRDHIN